MVTVVGRVIPTVEKLLLPDGPSGDTLTLEVPLAPDATADPFTLGVVRSVHRASFLTGNADLKTFATRKLTALPNLPAGLEALSEHRDVLGAALQGEAFNRAVAHASSTLLSVHITSEAGMSSALKTKALSARVAQFTFAVPPKARLDAELRPWVVFVLSQIDALHGVKLGRDARAAVQEAREAREKEAAKKAALEAQAQQRAKVAEAKIAAQKQRAAALAQMDRESRRIVSSWARGRLHGAGARHTYARCHHPRCTWSLSQAEEKDRLEALKARMPKMKRI